MRGLKQWEMITITAAVVIFSFCEYLLIGDISVRTWLFGDPEGQGEVIGQVESRAGSLRRQLLRQVEFRKVDQGTPLYQRDTVVTGEESRAVLKLEDGSAIELGNRSMVRLIFDRKFSLTGVHSVAQVVVARGSVSVKAEDYPIELRSGGRVIPVLPSKPPVEIKAATPTHSRPRVIAYSLPETPVTPAPTAVAETVTEVKKPEVPPPAPALRILPSWVSGEPIDSNLDGILLDKKFSITLRWSSVPGAKSYHVRGRPSEKAKNFIFNQTVTETQFTYQPRQIPDAPIFYEVSANLEDGKTLDASPATFVFKFLPPTLAQPGHGALISPESPGIKGDALLTWQKTAFTNEYELEVAQDREFRKIRIKRKTEENFFVFRPPAEGQYWWRVRSHGDSIVSQYSKPRMFRVQE